MRATLFLLAALAATALAGPTGQRSTCAIHCKPSDTFNYEIGKSYIFDYTVSTSTALLGTFDDEALMNILAEAHIDVTSPCEYVLQLKNVKLQGSTQGQEFSEAIMKNPLRFSFQDGVVENLCSDVTEPAWVLNFKRGVLSTFQNSMNYVQNREVKEADVSGMCIAQYDVTSEGSTTTIFKTKDLSSCSQRPDLTTYLMSTTYSTDSPVQSLSIFDSNNYCEQTMENGILKEAVCQESHKYRPFSSDEGGAITKAKTSLRFRSQQESSYTALDFQMVTKSLIFDDDSTTPIESKEELAEKILNDLKLASDGEIRPEVPALFSELVSTLKTLDYPQLSNLYDKFQGEPRLKKFLTDAVPLVGTASAAGVLRDMYVNGDLTQVEVDFWFTSLAFLKNPDPRMFTAIAPLLEGTPSQKVMLGTSALVNNYCKVHSDCDSESGVIEVIRGIEAHLGSGCRATSEEEKMKILIALKSLGNAGRWVNANSVLRRCFTEEENDMEIRVAALEAWRHTPCEYDRSNVQAAFLDETQDSEVRIAAYLALMSCPTQTVIDVVKDRLTSESVNQVTSFVWTHMTNLQESASPEKLWLHDMIGDDLLQSKFNQGSLKFSRNFESSFFMNELNVGATVESNVIFSSKSYLPRSGMLNLTLDLFGESINFFEVGGRIEGFEMYIERLFSSQGYFPEETVEGILRTMREQNLDHEPTTLEGYLDKVTDEPEGSYYLRVFGNELHYQHFHGLENIFKTSDISNPLEFLMDLIRQGNVDYSKSYQLFDNHYTIPTLAGLPLAVTAKGIATLGLQMNGNFKVSSLSNIDIEGHIHPSAAVEIDGLMLVDAHVTQTGLKVKSNLHSSTFLDGKMKISKGKLVDIAFNTPKEKVEVISVKTEYFHLENGQETMMEGKMSQGEQSCTPVWYGLAYCRQNTYMPRLEQGPQFPLDGPFATDIYLKKTDTQTGYILKFENKKNEISFLLDTPESQSNQKILVNLKKTNKAFAIDIQTPLKSIQGNGEYVWTKKNKNVKMTLMVDGDQYGMDASLQTDSKSNIYEPSLVITTPSGELTRFNGFFQMVGTSVDVGLEFKTPMIEANIKNNFNTDLATFISFTTTGEYTIRNGNKQTAQKSLLLKKEISDENTKYSVGYEFTTSEYPSYSVMLDFSTTVTDIKHIESKGKLILGSATWEGEQKWLFTSVTGQTKLENVLTIKCPQNAVDFVSSFNFVIMNNNIQGDVLLRTAPGKDIAGTISLSKTENTDISVNIAVQAVNFKGAFEVNYDKIALGHHKIQVITKMNDETCLLEGTFKNKFSRGKINTSVTGICKCSSYDIKTKLELSADKAQALLNMNTNVNGHDYTAKLEGSLTSLLIDINIIKHIVFNAYVTATDELSKVMLTAEWDKDVDPTKSIVIGGEITVNTILVNLRFLEKELLLSSKLMANGAELEAKWEPEKRIHCTVSYDMSNGISLTATVLTPFAGLEKQDVTFKLSTEEYGVDSRFIATWKNSEQISLSVKANVEPGMFTNAMKASIIFSSTIDRFERISVALEHSMNNARISSKIEGTWDEKEVKGTFELIPNENGIDGRFSFASPLTEEILITLKHAISDQTLNSILEFKSGVDTLTLSARGHLELSDVHNIALVVKMDTTFTSVVPVNVNMNYNNDGKALKVLAEGVMGDQKLMFSMNGKIAVAETTIITGDLRFLTPFTYPLTAHLNHRYDESNFTTDFEMSRIWSSYGNLKVHGEGHLASENDIGLNIVMSSPSNKASLTINHKVAEKKMVSTATVLLNGDSFNVNVSGVLSDASNLENLEAEITSTFYDLDDMKLQIKSQRTNNTIASKAILVKGDKSLRVNHILTVNDILNWENSIQINENYRLKNKQTYSGNEYGHSLEYDWNTKSINLDLAFSKEQNSNFSEVETKITLTTPWTETVKGKLLLKYNDVEYNPVVTIEYSPGQVLELNTTVKFEDAFYYVESFLTTPFWQTLGIKLNVDFKPRPAITLVLIRGDNKTTIDIGGQFGSGKLDGHLEIHSTYLTFPLSIEARYDVLTEEKSAHLVISYDKKYEIKGLISGNFKSAKWDLKAEMPFEKLQNIECKGEYDFTTLPLVGDLMFNLNSQKYQVNMNINVNNFAFFVNLNGNEGKLSGNWLYNQDKANVNIVFESPCTTIESFSLYAMYDLTDEKRVEIKFVKGTKEITLDGKLENNTVLINAQTPFTGWENMMASFFISESAVSAFASRNDVKIELDGTLHVKPGKGKANLIIKSTLATFEQISADLEYSVQGPIKSIEFVSTYGSKQISLKGIIDITDGLAPEVKLDIITPFDVVTKLGGLVKWNFKMPTKTAVVNAYRNDHEYKWEIEATADSFLKGHAEINIETPVVAWTSVKIVGGFDFTSAPYQFMFTTEKEGNVKTFTGKLDLTHNAVSVELVTPIPGWEKIVVKGDYTFEENHLTFASEITTGPKNFSINGNIIFDTRKPKLDITLKTPISGASSINLKFDANLIESTKKLVISLNIDDILYSVDASGQYLYKSGDLRLVLQSPIQGYQSTEFSAKFDFTGDIKMAEVDYVRDDQKQHVSVAAQVNDNNIVIEIQTPFEDFKVLKFNGDYTFYSNEHKVEASYSRNGEQYIFKGSLLPNDLLATLKISTPIEFIKNFEMQGKVLLLEDGFETYLNIIKNSEIFELNNEVKVNPLKSSFMVSVKTPIRGWKDLMLNIEYDVQSNSKSASVLVKKESFLKKISFEGSFTPTSGSFKIETPIEGYNVFGAEYSLDLSEVNNKLDAHVKFYSSIKEWIFTAHGEYSSNKILIRFQTPFEGYDVILIDAHIDSVAKVGKCVIEFGVHRFTLDMSYTKDNIHLKVTTPFDSVKTASIQTKYTWTDSDKNASVKLIYNEYIFDMQGILKLSKETSEVLMHLTTPIQDLSQLTFKFKYDITNPEELVILQVNVNDQPYGFTLGGFIEEKVGYFSVEAATPINEWERVKFSIKLDMAQEDNNLEIIGEKNGNVKIIYIKGKLIGDLIDINLKTPFTGLQDFKMFGSLDRVKRSLEFQMMSDASQASIAANFNSAKLELKTPFAAAQNIRWEIVKVDESTIKADWRRNDNYVTIDIKKQGRKSAFSIEISSEFQGWEFLALTGRLDREEVRGYLSGQLNEDKITLSGSGQFDTKGTFNLDIQTPYENYRAVNVQLNYNLRTKVFKIEASSSSSNFHFILERNRSGVLSHHSIFPNETKPTEISMNLSVYNGKVTITSRFPFIRDYYQEYHANIGPIITIDHVIRWNDLEVFKLDLRRDGPNKKVDLEIHARRPDHHTTIELHAESLSTANLLISRDGKEFRVDLQGTGNLPYQGELKITVNNSFPEVPRQLHMTVNYNVHPDTENKHVKVEITTNQGRLYILDLNFSSYAPRLKNVKFSLRITTPERDMAPWKDISGSWNVEDQSNANISFKIGETEYTAQGKITLLESTLVLVPSNPSSENIFFQWTFKRSGADKDYFLKLGRESKYGMLKLKGRIEDYAHVDIEGGFKLGPFMRQEFLFSSRWNKESDNLVNGGGSFQYGAYNGEHTIKFMRDGATRSATFEASGTSNVPNYQRVSLRGSYDFNHKAVIDITVDADGRQSRVNVNFTDLNPRRSRNTISVNIPILESYGQMELTLSHDFQNPTSKSFEAVASFADREAYVKANWERSTTFDKLQGNLDIKSRFVGEVHINFNFDVSNIDNAHAEANYSRIPLRGPEKNASFKWTLKGTPENKEFELVLESPLEVLRHGRVFVKADLTKIFSLTARAEYNDKNLTFDFDINKKSISFKVTTPIADFELIEGTLKYNLGGKQKTVQLAYERGERKVNMDFTLNIKPKKEGDFDFTLTTPFEFVRELHIDGKWNKKNAAINYKRNDVVLEFQGKADIKADKSSFDLSFTPSSGNTVRVAGSYDVQALLEGSGSTDKNVASLEIEFDRNSISFNINGFRNDERVFFELDGKTSFARIKSFHFKLDVQLSTQQRDGHIEISVNDFKLKLNNHFERRGDSGYYFKSHIESSLTRLPALIIGVGHDGEQRIITIGYGDEKEITFSVKGKDNFRSGFSGFVDIPFLGYEGIKYEAEYHFENSNELQVEVDIELGSEGDIEADFTYNSEGVEARLSSLATGTQSMRIRRSVSSDGFYAEAGVNDYNLKLRGGFDSDDTKRGFLLEGEVFGKTFSVDALLQSEGIEYTEGKFIIKTPFQGWENIGGLFTWACVKNKVMSHAEVMLPSSVTPKIVAEINLNMDKKVVGYITINLAGEEFTLKTDLIGMEMEGYQGTVELYTPFHMLSYVKISGNLKMAPYSFETSLKVSAPFVSFETIANIKFETNKIRGNFMLNSVQLETAYNIGITLEKTSLTAGAANLNINNNKFSIEYNLQDKSFLASIDTLVQGIQRKISLDTTFESLDKLEGTLMLVLGSEIHKIQGNMNINSSRITGTIDVVSSLIGGERKLSFDVFIPSTSFEEFSIDVMFITEQSHNIHFDFKVYSEILINLKIDTPIFPKINADLSLSTEAVSLSVDTPQGIHKLLMNWKLTRKMPSDWIGNLELTTPLLPVDYKLNIMVGGDRTKRTLKLEFTSGTVKHVIEGFASISKYGGSFSLNVETPFKNINKATIEGSLNFDTKVELHLSSTFASKVNTFDFVFDKEGKSFMSVVESPFIPTGMAKVEALLAGDLTKHLQIKVNILNNVDTIASIFNVRTISSKNVKVNLKITTPFKGYKKMNFSAEYIQNDEDTTILLQTEKPLKLKAELKLGNLDNAFQVDFKVDTEMKTFELLEGHLLIPLNTFQPKISTNMVLNGEYYGAYLGVRTKAPYELAYGLHLSDITQSKFHIRTDSSFFTFLY